MNSTTISLPATGDTATFTLLCNSNFYVTGGATPAPTTQAPPSSCGSALAQVLNLTAEPNAERTDPAIAIADNTAATPGSYTPAADGRLFAYTTTPGDTEKLKITITEGPDTYSTTELGVSGNAAISFEATAGNTYAIELENIAEGTAAANNVVLNIRPAYPIITGMQSISMGLGHACFLLEGAAHCVGSNRYGNLGAGLTATSSFSSSDRVSLLRPVTGLVNNVMALSVGTDHTCAVYDADGAGSNLPEARCWGKGDDGQLGNNDSSQEINNSPLMVVDSTNTALRGFQAISAGKEHTCAIYRSSGDDGAMCWGKGDLGQLGDGNTGNHNTPQQVATGTENADGSGAAAAFTTGITAISSGGFHTCAIRSGKAYCWGLGLDGRLGIGATSETCGFSGCATAPREVGSINGAMDTVRALSSGNLHTCAIIHNSSSGEDRAMCWGSAGTAGQPYGRLGNGVDSGNFDTPQQVTDLDSGTLSAISAADLHTCAIHDADGAGSINQPQVKCWGSTDRGRLGDGTTSGSPLNTPVMADLPLNFVPERLSTGYSAWGSCASDAQGQPLCWGIANDGISGDGTTGNFDCDILFPDNVPDCRPTPGPVYDSSSF